MPAEIEMFYRGIRFTKDFIQKYLTYIFFAGEKGQILFTDGTKKISFSNTPIVVKRVSWDYRSLPAVLIGKASGGLRFVSFTGDLLDDADENDPEQTTRYGGDFDFTVGLTVVATTTEERDNLVDITGIYLAHPDAKTYFAKQYITIAEAPKIVGENDLKEPKIDFPVYATDLSFHVLTRWEESRTITEYRLLDVLVDIEAVLDFSS